MKKSNLLTEDDRVDYEKLRAYIDQWAADNPEFSEAILEAKKHCAYRDSANPTECDADQIFVCLTANIIWVSMVYLFLLLIILLLLISAIIFTELNVYFYQD